MGFKIIILYFILILFGCSSTSANIYSSKKWTQRPYKINGKWYTPVGSSKGFEQTGIASWYGKYFHGKKTSNGEIYNMYAMTAAHKTLPIGTYVKVSKLSEQREVIVRINDRGPFVKGRIVDLSYKAAVALGIENEGTAKVKLKALGRTQGDQLIRKDYSKGNYYVQVGAFSIKKNALQLRDSLRKEFGSTIVTHFKKGNQNLYRVRVGLIQSLDKAEETKTKIEKKGIGSPFIVAKEEL